MDAKRAQKETIGETPVWQREYRKSNRSCVAKKNGFGFRFGQRDYRKYEGIRHCKETKGNTKVAQRDYRTREGQVIAISPDPSSF